MRFRLPEILESLYVRSRLAPSQVMHEVEKTSAAYGRGEPCRIDDEKAAVAYALYFLPEHFLKPFLVVSDLLARGLLKSEKRLKVVDVGTGPGTATWAVAEALCVAGDERHVDAVLLDRSPHLLRTAERIAGGYASALSVETREVDLTGAPIPPADLVLFCNTLSELGDPGVRMEVVKRALRAAGGTGAVVVIEPDSVRGGEVANSLFAELTDRLLAPCPTTHAFDIATPVPPGLQRVVNAGHRRQKFFFAVATNTLKGGNTGLCRVVEPFRKLKWGYRAVLHGDQRLLSLVVKSKSLEDRRKLESIGEGDLVSIAGEPTPDGRWDLDSAERIKVVHSFAAPARQLAGPRTP